MMPYSSRSPTCSCRPRSGLGPNRFSGGVAPPIRWPQTALASLAGGVQLLEARGRSPSDRRAWIGDIEQATLANDTFRTVLFTGEHRSSP
jgi:hypothetical protein